MQVAITMIGIVLGYSYSEAVANCNQLVIAMPMSIIQMFMFITNY